MKRVVITGMGAVTPIGNTLSAYLDGLREGRSGAAPITLFDATEFKTQFACEVKGFESEAFFDRKEARKMDRFTQLAIVAADESIQEAGISDDAIDKDQVGVIWAAGIGGLGTLELDIESNALSNGPPRYNPFMIPKMIANIAGGMISMRHGFRGMNFCTVSACASSTHAISTAFDSIRLGRNKIIITGGSEAVVLQTSIGGFNAMRALSTRNDSPATASRPFDATRDGFVLGEGAGALVLEELDHALARGATIYAEVVGAGATADAYHLTAPHPEGLGAIKVMEMALADAQMQASEVDYINVHGTSTPLGDIAEVTAISQVFGDHIYDLNISSTKSMTGHLLGAAGAIETIASVLAVKHNFVPPTINHFEDDPAFDSRINFTFNKAQEREVNAALSNTFGFGGHNSSVIVRKYKP